MLLEINMIREEIHQLNDRWADLPMLESLTNNMVFVLSKFQQNPPADTPAKFHQLVADTISELLNTLNKEIKWASELSDSDPERGALFKKAKTQILDDSHALIAG